MRFFIGIWCLVFLFVFPVSGQQLQFNSRTFEYQNEPLKVRKLYQDRSGFIWMGTGQGLFRYDGYRTEPYLPSGKKSLPPVSAFFQDRKNRLWVGCENGKIFVLEKGSLAAFAPQEGTPAEAVLDIEEDAKGNIWFATYGEGIYCYKNQRLYNLNTDDGLPDNYVYTLAICRAGNIWAGTDRGIAVCNFNTSKKQIRKVGVSQGLPDNIVTALEASPDGKTIWAGTYTGGFCSISAASMQVTRYPASENWNGGAIARLFPSGNSWLIGTDASSLLEFDPTQPDKLLSLYQNNTGSRLKVSDLLVDAEGFCWVAGNTPEVYSANPALKFISPEAESKGHGIHAVLADKKGNIWYSTDEGVFQTKSQGAGYKAASHIKLPFSSGLKVISLFEDATGKIWAGTFGDGVFRYDPATGKARQFTERDGLINNNVLSIAGTGNEIWLATLGGASRCRIASENLEITNAHTFENFNKRDGIGFNYIYQVFIDSRKRIWFATDGKGLVKLENGKFSRYSEKEGLSARTIYSIAETANGTLWISTPKAGLFRLQGNKFENFGFREGLRDLDISSLAQDRFGKLVVLHKKGIDILDPVSGKVRYLGKESGLQMQEPDLNAISRDASGSIWFGSAKGLTAYLPAKADLPVAPAIQIANVQLFLKPLTSASNVFRHDENHITFDYAGLWYQAPEEVSYRLKLEGYDREWILSNNRSITYPKLPPGKYNFKVSASAGAGFAAAPTQTYAFTIEKPFWETIWFYSLSFLAAGGVLFGFIKSREKRVKKAERLEKDKVMFQFETLKNQVNPHFLFNSFNTLINIIEDDQEAAVTYVEKLSDFFRDILVYREKDTITLREELVLIRNYYFLQQQRYGSNLKVLVEVPEADQEQLIAPLTLQLLVENAIKHNIISRDKPLTVEILPIPDNYLLVRNNLQPKKQPEKSTGIGLANIRKRYEILGKKPVIIEQSDTVFEVKIPLFKPQRP